MIIANIKPSVKRLVEDVRLGIDDALILEQLQHITTTKWASLNDDSIRSFAPDPELLYKNGDPATDDFILGVSGDQIVSVYTILGWHREDNRVVFDVARARSEMAAAVGQPPPGGPWKRGEARPIRYVDTFKFVRELYQRDPKVDDYQDGDVERRMVEVIRALAGPPPATSLLEGVEVERDPRGGVRVTVPMGTKVTIVQRDDR